jgi:hypothetical protein
MFFKILLKSFHQSQFWSLWMRRFCSLSYIFHSLSPADSLLLLRYYLFQSFAHVLIIFGISRRLFPPSLTLLRLITSILKLTFRVYYLPLLLLLLLLRFLLSQPLERLVCVIAVTPKKISPKSTHLSHVKRATLNVVYHVCGKTNVTSALVKIFVQFGNISTFFLGAFSPLLCLFLLEIRFFVLIYFYYY